MPKMRPCQPRQLLETCLLGREASTAVGRQPVSLLVPRLILQIDRGNPARLEQPPQRAVHRPRAEANPSLAEPFDLLHQQISVVRAARQGREDQEDRFSERLLV